MNSALRLRDLSEVELRAVKVAFYLAQGMSETEITGLLFPPEEPPETARPKVSNAKKLALRKGWLRRPAFSGKSFSQEDNLALREEAHHHDWLGLEKELREQSGHVLKNLRVFYSGGNEVPKNKDEWDDAVELFAQNAAPYVLEQLCKSKSGIAVGWGTTVACAIEALGECIGESARLRQNEQKKISIVPTAGYPLQPPKGRDTASTSVARMLNDYLNGPRSGRVLSLENIPSVLAEIFKDDAKRKTFLEGFRYLRDYWEILGDQDDPNSNSWVNRVDTIISSGGAFHQWQIFADALLHNSGIVKDDLTKLAVGDIGGVLIPRLGLNAEDMARFEQIRRLWTGIRLEKYQRIARDAARCSDPDGPAGSVLVAIGKNKAEIILDLVIRDDTRVVNSLLIDVYLARAIRRLLDERKNNQASPRLKK